MASTEAAAAAAAAAAPGAIDFPALKKTNWISDENANANVITTATATVKSSAESACGPMLFTPYFRLSSKAATPTLSFKPLDCCKRAGLLTAAKGHGLFCVYYEKSGARVVRSVCKKAGMVKSSYPGKSCLLWTSTLHSSEYVNLLSAAFKTNYTECSAACTPRINHSPGTWELGRKDKLARNIARMRRRCPAERFGLDKLSPKTFVIPDDWLELVSEARRHPGSMFIKKPTASSRGRGISILNGINRLKQNPQNPFLIQKYIVNPLLIDGQKFDIRLYVAITSWDPLRVYVHQRGLVRLSTEKYTNDSRKRCVHLTNCSIQSRRSKYCQADLSEEPTAAHKWSLDTLWRYLDSHFEIGTSTRVWQRLQDVVVKAVISAEANANATARNQLKLLHYLSSCFELFGVDILLDRNLHPWLLEFNTGPALHAPSLVDKGVKTDVVSDLLHLIGIQATLGKGRSSVGLTKRAGIKTKTTRAAEEVQFCPPPSTARWASCALPEVVTEAELELARSACGEFVRLMPAADSQLARSYACLFEAKRINNIVLERWEAALRDKWPSELVRELLPHRVLLVQAHSNGS